MTKLCYFVKSIGNNLDNRMGFHTGFHLESSSVVLRPYQDEDAPNFIELVTDYEFSKFSPLAPLTKREAEKVLVVLQAHLDGKVFEFWTAVDKKTKNYAGFVGYNPVIFEKNTYELFYLGFLEQYRNSDIPLQSARLARDFAFKNSIQALIAFVHPQDYPTLRCFYNLPGKLEREEALFYGASVYMFSMLA